jgi:squalene synthase HpnC/squalene synthase HpnD
MHPASELEIARTLPPPGASREEAQRYTRWLATHHYENFTVVSLLLPRGLRQHFCNIYAYCRWADDLGDEIPDRQRALGLLDWWEDELRACYEGSPSHAVFVALRQTVQQCEIPIEPFRDLLTAFRQDQRIQRYPDWDAVLNYCRYSANPVGRLVLYVCGYRDAERQRLSDATCTALQLTNFWQDVARDLEKGRIYIPLERLAAHGLTEADIVAKKSDPRFVGLMRELIAYTRRLFEQGRPLVEMVSAELRIDIDLFSRGGLEVLAAIERIGYDTFHRRPTLGSATKLRLFGRALAARAFVPVRSVGAKPPVPIRLAREEEKVAGVGLAEVEASYRYCRDVTCAAARNFYYGILLLPRAKRDAVCALYAFMRQADDFSDQAGDAAAKKRRLAEWRATLDRAVSGEPAAHPAMPALRDAVQRFAIPARYFHDLISGVEMDLEVASYATFERLREYCYRVAGTVGLTCLHIFGFSDPRAPECAEKLGIAFQLTNILRDIAEDFGMGRVYLPAEDLARFGVAREELGRGVLTPAIQDLLRFEADRAWQFYREGAELLPLVGVDSRPALWALVQIYTGILKKIEARGYEVFSAPRVGLSTAEKTWIMARAWLGHWRHDYALEERDRHRRGAGGTLRRHRTD